VCLLHILYASHFVAADVGGTVTACEVVCLLHILCASHFVAADGGRTITACEVVCFTYCVLHILLLLMEAGQ